MMTFQFQPALPFRLDLTAWALRRRPDNIIDQWDGTTYGRVLVCQNFGDVPLKIKVSQTGTHWRPLIHVEASGNRRDPDAGIRRFVQASLEKVIGLKADLRGFYGLAGRDKYIKHLVDHFRGLRPPRFPTIFEALVNAFACQQISLNVGIILLNRLAQSYGLVFREEGTVSFAFPRPEDLSEARPEDLRRLGFSIRKSIAIIELSRRIVTGELDLNALEDMDDEQSTEYLQTLKGIGRWSAEYVMLRGLGRLNLFPGDDVGAQKNLFRLLKLRERPDYEKIKDITKRWQPYPGLVYFHLLLDKLEKEGYL